MRVAAAVHAGLTDSMADNLTNPPFTQCGLIKSRAGKDHRREEMFEPGVGIVMTPVHVPGLGEGADLKHHCQLCTFSGTQEKGRHGTHGS